jgi:hypothetical protein
MCVKIICNDHEHEFDPNEPLENQIEGAKEVFVSYSPMDSKIPFLFEELDRLCNHGISCRVAFKFKANNNLEGFRMERRLEKIKQNLEINEIVKSVSNMYAKTDRKLEEISVTLLGKANEQ